jgi:hypothetical protein
MPGSPTPRQLGMPQVKNFCQVPELQALLMRQR